MCVILFQCSFHLLSFMPTKNEKIFLYLLTTEPFSFVIYYSYPWADSSIPFSFLNRYFEYLIFVIICIIVLFFVHVYVYAIRRQISNFNIIRLCSCNVF